jgi:hypothetical protein
VRVAGPVRFVAVHARYGAVGAGQRKTGLTVPDKRESRGGETLNAVARLAFVNVPFFELS